MAHICSLKHLLPRLQHRCGVLHFPKHVHAYQTVIPSRPSTPCCPIIETRFMFIRCLVAPPFTPGETSYFQMVKTHVFFSRTLMIKEQSTQHAPPPLPSRSGSPIGFQPLRIWSKTCHLGCNHTCVTSLLSTMPIRWWEQALW